MDTKAGEGLSRRDFAQRSALVGAGALAAAKAAHGARQVKKGTVKVGIIGCGGRMSADIARLLGGNEDVVLTAMADVFEDKLQGLKGKLEGQKDFQGKIDVPASQCFVGWDAYKGLLDTDVDLVLDACTPYVRPDHVEAAVAAGKHLFVEKPVAVDPVGVRQFMAAAEKHKAMGLTMVAGTQSRHSPNNIETVKQIHAGAIGEVRALYSWYCSSLPWHVTRNPAWSDGEYAIRNWYNFCWCSGDNIVEQAIHLIDLCNWVAGGPPQSVYASGGRAWKPREESYGDLWDNFACDYVWENGLHHSHYCRHWDGTDGAHGVEIVAAKGKSDGGDMHQWQGDSTVQMHQDLIASIRGEGEYLHQGQRVAESTLTAIMGRMSAYTGARITWEEAMNSDLRIVPEKVDFTVKIPMAPIPVPEVKPKPAIEKR